MKLNIPGIIILFLLLSNADGQSQLSTEWIQRHNGEGNGVDDIYAMTIDPGGNVYAAGRTYGNGTAYDYLVLKYNSSGNLLWSRNYNGTGNGNDYANAVAVDNSGNVFVTGESAGLTSGKDYLTVKYNSDGAELWVKRFNGEGNSQDIANSITVDSSGNCYVTGGSYGSGFLSDYATLKYGTDGTELWIRYYAGSGNGNDVANFISTDVSGNIIVTGESSGSGTNFDYSTVKYNSSGVELWVQRYNNVNGRDIGKALVTDDSGNVIVTGESLGSGTNTDYATIKYNSSGQVIWVSRYVGPANSGQDEARAIISDNSGNIIVTGVSVGNSTSYDFATVKYSSSGEQLWVQRYNGPGNNFDEATSVASDNSGNIYVTGFSFGSGTLDDIAVIKYSPTGIMQWVHRYNGPGNGNDNSKALVISGSGSIYVSGGSTGIGTNLDATIIKYSELTNTGSSNLIEPHEFILSQNYPNPFNPSTMIKFSLPKSSFVTLKVYNILGVEVKTIVNEMKNAGVYEVEFNSGNSSRGADIASGVYFYHLHAGDFNEIKSMILLK